MATHLVVKLHTSTYEGEIVGIYEYCRGFFSLPFTSYESGYHELMKARGNQTLNISDEEWKFLTARSEDSLPKKGNEKQKDLEKKLRKEYCDCKNQDILLKQVFDIDIDDPKIFDN